MGEEMEQAEQAPSEVLLSNMTPETARRSRSLSYMLTMFCEDAALVKLQNTAAGANNGLEAWRQFVDEWAPQAQGRHRAMLQAIINYDFAAGSKDERTA
eukprot:4143075-Amphidinium_carterae.2